MTKELEDLKRQWQEVSQELANVRSQIESLQRSHAILYHMPDWLADIAKEGEKLTGRPAEIPMRAVEITDRRFQKLFADLKQASVTSHNYMVLLVREHEKLM